jgi:Ribonuclease G/E
LLHDVIEHYPGERPIFDLHGVEDEIQKGLERKVHLKSGSLAELEDFITVPIKFQVEALFTH